jgi:hypothetical protein
VTEDVIDVEEADGRRTAQASLIALQSTCIGADAQRERYILPRRSIE